MEPLIQLVVEETTRERLDRFIARQQPALSRSYIQKLIADGHVYVNNKSARASRKIKPGDRIDITQPPPEPSPLAPEDIPLEIIYEDADLLVIDKPAGMTTHPAPGNMQHTLVNALLSHLPGLPESDNPARPGIVHRLDKDTSGLILVAKNRHALNYLSGQFQSREVKKTYLALVQGKVTPATGVIDAPVGRDAHNRQKMAISATGRTARTAYSVIKYLSQYTLLEARPETGRTHQIRVHFAAVGHPVAGDSTYGNRSALLSRQFLHAHKLSFKLPSSGATVEFTSPLPRDLQTVLDLLS
jgi:23S rRNA pseudouridine1911/1915/1917 synthase